MFYVAQNKDKLNTIQDEKGFAYRSPVHSKEVDRILQRIV